MNHRYAVVVQDLATQWIARRMESEAGPQQAAVDSRGSRTCVCANTHEWPDLGWRSGVNSEPGVGIAVDWVTGRSYCFAIEAGRRLNVESGLRRASWALKRCLREADGSRRRGLCCSAAGIPMTRDTGWNGGRSWVHSDAVEFFSGSYAVFTEQGSSASQMMAAKVMDVTARLPDCDGQAVDAASAYTQVKLEDAPRLL